MKSIQEITLDWVHASVVDQDGCLIWTDACGGKTGGPRARIGGVLMTMRRVIWTLAHEKPVPKNRRVVTSCRHPRCVHPDHLLALFNNQQLRGVKSSITHRVRIASTLRARSAWTDEQIREVAASVGTVDEVAAQYGMSRAYVSRIRLNKARIDFTNPYLQLLEAK